MHKPLTFVLILLAGLAGCAQQRVVDEPGNITLSQAMRDTVDALADAHQHAKDRGVSFGLYACTATAVFNISATGVATNIASLTLSGGPPAVTAPVSLGLSKTSTSTETGARGNTVTLVLATPWCSPSAQTQGGQPAKAASGSGGAGGKKTTAPVAGSTFGDFPPIAAPPAPPGLLPSR
jgi:hypothetical protein